MTLFTSARAAIAAAVSAAALTVGAGAASAATVDVTIDFGTSDDGFSNPYIEDGFEIAGTKLAPSAFGNPDTSIFFDSLTPTLTLTRTGGGAFSLKAFDYSCGPPCDFTVGGTQFVGVIGWVTRGLDLANITSLVFSRTTRSIRLDNIVLSYELPTTVPPGPGPGISPVPLPAALPLLLAGIGGLGLVARRKAHAA
jgi:hypothetical protein